MRNLIVAFVVVVSGCGNKDACNLADPVNSCSDGQVCEQVGGSPGCAAPLVVRGSVASTVGGTVIASALVGALDANEAPASGAARADANGAYELRVPAARTAEGAIAAGKVKLRAQAAGYETFPFGIRRSLPIELSTAVKIDGKWVIDSAQTDISLIPVPNAAGLGAIAGSVKNGAGVSGALIVATGPATMTTVSDVDGAYELYNMPAGSYTVTAYRAGANFTPATANVAGATVSGVDLALAGQATAAVSGNVNIVNAPGGSMTSVVMIVESTFNDALKRGETPPGLRAPDSGTPSISGAFSIAGVPDGRWVVLAAFENDALVRDPDTQIAGTQIVHIQVAGGSIELPTSFKITEALRVISPGAADAPEEVTGMPVFKWADDSSEDRYTVELFDWKGTVVMPATQMPSVSGGDVSFTYTGALTPGGYYQFRATSWRKQAPISTTEDLRGVFIAK
jgi:hypothetical protein